MNKKKAKKTCVKDSRARATPYSFEEAKQLLNAIAEVYEETCVGMLPEKEAKCRGYLLQVAGGLYRNCEIERRMDKLEQELAKLEKS